MRLALIRVPLAPQDAHPESALRVRSTADLALAERQEIDGFKPRQGLGSDVPSTLSWLDFSEAERRRALQVVELFAVQETRDELGLGAIRDALSEAMFPGHQHRATTRTVLPDRAVGLSSGGSKAR